VAGAGVRSLGILGGTFNPPHVGHLAVARHAQRELGLERVLLMPVHISPHKAPGEDPGPSHRLAMCRLAVDRAPRLAVCAMEIERGGASYTVDTLKALHASHRDAELTLILGADTASTLPSWREPAQLLALARVAVAARAGAARRRVLEAVATIVSAQGGEHGSPPAAHGGRDPGELVSFLEMAAVDVSSSTVRARVADGEPIAGLVGPAVAAYIAEHGLYRTGAGAAR
jgi:nicotinate-nucleotide adenylyltransferase